MALFRRIQENIALDANNIARVEDEGNIISIPGNIFLYPPQGNPILYKSSQLPPFSNTNNRCFFFSNKSKNIHTFF